MSKNIENQTSWDGIKAWIETLEPLREQYLGQLTTLLKESQKKFDSKNLIEPAFRDWSKFRPLKTDNENDWSDWLAHLLENSTTGYFANILLNEGDYKVEKDYTFPKVKREFHLTTPDDEENRRSDLLMEWNDKTFTHIEVKKYDSDFKKTFPTSKYINEYFKTSAQHFILIPKGSREKCSKELDNEKDNFPRIKINLLIWNDVAASLRNTLINPDNKESNEWNVWANSFLGCLEQKLLAFTAFNQKLPMHEITKLINYNNKLSENKNMSDLIKKEDEFLEKGFSTYSQAKRALLQFENILSKRISELFNQNYWSQYKDIGKNFQEFKKVSSEPDFIGYNLKFKVKEMTKIIYLQIHFAANPLMLLTRIYYEAVKDPSILLKESDKFNDIKVIKDPYGYYFKLVPKVGKPFTLDKDLDYLIEATLAHEGYIKQSNQT